MQLRKKEKQLFWEFTKILLSESKFRHANKNKIGLIQKSKVQGFPVSHH